MGEVPALNIVDRASVSLARQQIRGCAQRAGLSETDTEWMLLAVSELAQNQLDHAIDGTIACSVVRRGGVLGIEIEAVDRGPGIAEPGSAIAGLLPGRGLGVGLAGVRRNVGELDVDVRIGASTTLRIRRFASEVPRHPEVAVIGRGLELPSGDSAWVARRDGALWLAAIDGLGHGEPARQASEQALAFLRRQEQFEPTSVLEGLHEALRQTRGAAITLARWDVRARVLEVAGVGNVAARLYANDGHLQGTVPTPGVLGHRRFVRPRLHRLEVAPRSVLLLATDGIASRIDPVPSIVGRSAAHIAQVVMAQAGKEHDDALVLIAR